MLRFCATPMNGNLRSASRLPSSSLRSRSRLLPAVDHKKFAAEINTKTLRAAAAVTIPPRRPLRVRH